MGEERSDSNQPVSQGFATWRGYWAALSMPWRTEPEIDAERQRYLAERRAVKPDIERGLYPFREEHGSIQLTRADVEWLLATHESGGFTGPVESSDEKQSAREGADLRGADLRGVDLSRLPLACVRGGLTRDEWLLATIEQREWSALQLQGAKLYEAQLQRTILTEARLDRANLRRAQLQGAVLRSTWLPGADLYRADMRDAYLREARLAGAYLREVQFQRADLRDALMDVATVLTEIHLDVETRLADVLWNNAALTRIVWENAYVLGDEHVARRRKAADGTVKDGTKRHNQYLAAVRANRQLAVALRGQGLNEYADHFAARAQVLQRTVLRRQVFLRQKGHPHGLLWRARRFAAYIGSWFLAIIAGYGYRPGRSIFAYLLLVTGFAAAYFALGTPSGHPLQWYEALVVSLTAFHGRGFFAAQYAPGDPQAFIAAFEAVVGLLLEITFIATFTNRFFAR